MTEIATVLEAATVPAIASPTEVLRQQCSEVLAGRQCERAALRSDGKCARHSKLVPLPAEGPRSAGEILRRDSPEYAELHLQAARTAAEKGDATPAQWALLHSRSIEPIAKESGGGITVNVGMVLPGLPRPK